MGRKGRLNEVSNHWTCTNAIRRWNPFGEWLAGARAACALGSPRQWAGRGAQGGHRVGGLDGFLGRPGWARRAGRGWAEEARWRPEGSPPGHGRGQQGSETSDVTLPSSSSCRVAAGALGSPRLARLACPCRPGARRRTRPPSATPRTPSACTARHRVVGKCRAGNTTASCEKRSEGPMPAVPCALRRDRASA